MLKFGSAYNGALSAHSPKEKKKKRVSRKITQKGRRFSLSPAPATIKALLEEKRPFSRKFRNSLSLPRYVTIFFDEVGGGKLGAGNGGDDHSSGRGGGGLARKLAPSEEVIHWETKEEVGEGTKIRNLWRRPCVRERGGRRLPLSVLCSEVRPWAW